MTGEEIQELDELRDKVEELESTVANLVEFCKAAAIGSEQLWEVVFDDILKQPVPCGVDLREINL